jgi:hypothetical protein
MIQLMILNSQINIEIRLLTRKTSTLERFRELIMPSFSQTHREIYLGQIDGVIHNCYLVLTLRS